MATGKKAFEGKSQASLMAKILETDPPPMVTLVPMTPPALDRLVKRCLAKDPDRRWQSSGDLCEELKWIAEQGQGPQGAAASSASTRGSGERFAWIVAGVAFLIAAAAITSLFLSRRTVQPARAVRFTVAPPEKQTLPELADNVQAMSISPDGSKLAFVAMDSTSRFSLWVQDLDSQTARQLPGTDDAWSPFWSPDGQYIAFSTNNTLKKISVSGDSVESIATLPNMEMGTWNRNGDILVSSGYGFGHPILRVSSGGGPPTPITSLDFSVQASHRWPRFLPDGKHFLYTTIGQTSAASGIFVGALNSKETKQILNVNSIALYSPPGFLLFVRAGTLFAQPFDADRLELTGNAISVAQNVQFSATTGTAGIAVSDNGVLIYREVPKNGQFKLAWVDRKGIEQPLAAPPHTYRNPRLSPDGRRVAVTIDEQGSQEWLFDLGRSTLTRLTFEGNYNGGMAWSPDGKKIAFGSDRSGARNLFWEMADGSGVAERLAMAQTGGQVASSWSPDGQFLAFEQSKQAAGYDISVVRLADKKVQPFQAKATPFNEIAPRFSPDGRWLAYASDESGRYEIYVQPFPGPGGKSQVSTEGGTEPVWARNGELFYRSGNKMMVVETNTRTNFSASAPKMLFEGHFASYQTVPSFDVTPDGQRFLVSNPTGAARAEISVVLNWTDELKQKAGAGK
jgi:Tol biopolymer transport system component